MKSQLHPLPILSLLLSVAACSAGTPREAPRMATEAMCTTVETCAVEVGRNPADARLRVRYARVLTNSGLLGAAGKEYRAALRLDDEGEVLEEAAVGLARLGDAEGCKSELDALLADTRAGEEARRAKVARAREKCVAVRR